MGAIIGYFLLCSLIIDFILLALGMAGFTLKEITTQIVFGEVLLAVLFAVIYHIAGG